MLKFDELSPSNRNDKRWMIRFKTPDNRYKKTIHFGSRYYDNFTIHKDPERKLSYLRRHGATQDWSNPFTAASLSRWLLWNKENIEDSLMDYRRRFNL